MVSSDGGGTAVWRLWGSIGRLSGDHEDDEEGEEGDEGEESEECEKGNSPPLAGVGKGALSWAYRPSNSSFLARMRVSIA